MTGKRTGNDSASGASLSYVIVPGSRSRVDKISALWDERWPDIVVDGFRVVRGSREGVPMAVCATGIGGGAVARAVAALSSAGAHTLIRIGVTGALQPQAAAGVMVIAASALRWDGVMSRIVPIEYPALADWRVTEAIASACELSGIRYMVGVGGSQSSFYAGGGIPCHGGYLTASMASVEAEARDAGVLDWDTETAPLYVAGALAGVRCGRVNVVVNGVDDQRFVPEGEAELVEIGVGSVLELARRDSDALTV